MSELLQIFGKDLFAHLNEAKTNYYSVKFDFFFVKRENLLFIFTDSLASLNKYLLVS